MIDRVEVMAEEQSGFFCLGCPLKENSCVLSRSHKRAHLLFILAMSDSEDESAVPMAAANGRVNGSAAQSRPRSPEDEDDTASSNTSDKDNQFDPETPLDDVDSPDAVQLLAMLRAEVMTADWDALLERGTGLLAKEAGTANEKRRAIVWQAVADKIEGMKGKKVGKRGRKDDTEEAAEEVAGTKAAVALPDSASPLILEHAFSTLPRYSDRASRAAAQHAFLALASIAPRQLLPKIVQALDRTRGSKAAANSSAARLSIMCWTLGVIPLLTTAIVNSDAAVPKDTLKSAVSVACEASQGLPPKMAKQAVKLARSAVIRSKPEGAKLIIAAALELIKGAPAELKWIPVVCAVVDVAEHKKWEGVVGKEEVEKVAAYYGSAVLGSKTVVDEADQVGCRLADHQREGCLADDSPPPTGRLHLPLQSSLRPSTPSTPSYR